MGGAIVPRPVNMWKNQRRSRAFRDILEGAKIGTDFQVKVTCKNKEPKIHSLGRAAYRIGCDKWELAFYLSRDGVCTFTSGVKAEIVA